jgi:hypothetical protein
LFGQVPHGSSSLSGGQAAPPQDASVTTVRVRVRVPPHSAEQALQSLQSLTTQSTGEQTALPPSRWQPFVGMQRLLPLPKMQQTQPSLHTLGSPAQTLLPQ